jgi:RNA polymerase sigma-70 factor (ECF subfamily)
LEPFLFGAGVKSMPLDPDTAIGGHRDRFPSTRLSLIETAAAGERLQNQALDQVVALYWKPAYKYIRLKWNKNNEEAKDLTQSFFAGAIERDFFKRFDPQQASFRTYLRMALDHFAANEHAAAQRQKRGGGVVFTALDCDAAEAEAVECRAAESPEDLFLREWQRQLFAIAVDDLRVHCERNGKQLQFRIFEEYDLSDGARPAYSELAERHGIAITSITNHLAWARRMLRGLVMDRLRGVTSGDRELRDEMRTVFTRTR